MDAQPYPPEFEEELSREYLGWNLHSETIENVSHVRIRLTDGSVWDGYELVGHTTPQNAEGYIYDNPKSAEYTVSRPLIQHPKESSHGRA